MEQHRGVLRSYIGEVSQLIQDTALVEALSDHQQMGWLRIASLFRLALRDDPKNAAIAAAALEHLNKYIVQAEPTPQALSELDWVLDSTLSKIAPANWSGSIADLLSEAELSEVEAHLRRAPQSDEFDIRKVRRAIETQLETYKAFASLSRITNIDRKIECLLEIAERGGEAARPARAALRYLATVDDVVPDTDGLLGLLDDLYAVEWGYACVEAETRRLPDLHDMMRKWPYLASALITVDGRMLERFPRYVLGAANSLLFESGSGSIVLRDIGAFPFLIAVSAAFQCARLNAGAGQQGRAAWMAGDPLVIDDGVQKFKVRHGGEPRIEGATRIEVAGNATMHLDTEAARYLRPAPQEFKRLSKGSDISKWRDNRHPHPLHFFCGGDNYVGCRSAVMIVTRRGKSERIIPGIRSQGMGIGAVLGIVWVRAPDGFEPLGATTGDRPSIYVCGSAETAGELLENPPEDVADWKIVADGAAAGRDLRAIMNEAGITEPNVVTVTSLAERPDDTERRFRLVEDHEVVPAGEQFRGFRSGSALGRFLDRQANHWLADRKIEILRCPPLEDLADAVSELTDDGDGDPGLAMLQFSARKYLRDATRLACPDQRHLRELKSAAESLRVQAATLAGFNASACRVGEVLASISRDGLRLPDFAAAIRSVQSGIGDGGRPAVVCGTAEDAARNLSSATDLDVRFIGFNEMAADAPFEHMIVLGWLQSERMRRIALSGFAKRTTLLLLEYQKKWLDRTLAAMSTWEHRLEHLSRAVIDEARASDTSKPGLMPWPRTERRAPAAVEPAARNDDGRDIEDVDITALQSMTAAVSRPQDGDQTAKGRFVLFEQKGAYCLLPPDGSVIVLPDISDEAVHASDDQDLFVRVGDLSPRMVVAFSHEKDRDVVDAFADLFLDDPDATRSAAALWRQPVRAAFDRPGGVDALRAKLAEKGVKRHPFTLRGWASDSAVAPRGYQRVVPVLASLSDDPAVTERVPETLEAIARIYQARREGGKLLLKAVFDGDIDVSAPRLERSFDDRRISFDLYRVAAIGGTVDCLREDLGLVRRFSRDIIGEAVS